MQYLRNTKYWACVGIFFEQCAGMKQTKTTPQPNSRSSDVAILFLRFFIGAVSLLHIIGKLQTYDNTILLYPEILGLDAATSFAVVTIVEGLMTALIVLGYGTRFAAAVMSIISALILIYWIMMGIVTADMKLNFVYMGIYISLIISGGGYYSFRVPDLRKKMS